VAARSRPGTLIFGYPGLGFRLRQVIPSGDCSVTHGSTVTLGPNLAVDAGDGRIVAAFGLSG
jgi:hypothetical protein